MIADIWNNVPVLINDNKNKKWKIQCGYKWSDCKCGRKYKTENGFKRAHQIEY